MIILRLGNGDAKLPSRQIDHVRVVNGDDILKGWDGIA